MTPLHTFTVWQLSQDQTVSYKEISLIIYIWGSLSREVILVTQFRYCPAGKFNMKKVNHLGMNQKHIYINLIIKTLQNLIV
jgi:hypothetical protein